MNRCGMALWLLAKGLTGLPAMKSRGGYIATDYGELLPNGVVCEEGAFARSNKMSNPKRSLTPRSHQCSVTDKRTTSGISAALCNLGAIGILR